MVQIMPRLHCIIDMHQVHEYPDSTTFKVLTELKWQMITTLNNTPFPCISQLCLVNTDVPAGVDAPPLDTTSDHAGKVKVCQPCQISNTLSVYTNQVTATGQGCYDSLTQILIVQVNAEHTLSVASFSGPTRLSLRQINNSLYENHVATHIFISNWTSIISS